MKSHTCFICLPGGDCSLLEKTASDAWVVTGSDNAAVAIDHVITVICAQLKFLQARVVSIISMHTLSIMLRSLSLYMLLEISRSTTSKKYIFVMYAPRILGKEQLNYSGTTSLIACLIVHQLHRFFEKPNMPLKFTMFLSFSTHLQSVLTLYNSDLATNPFCVKTQINWQIDMYRESLKAPVKDDASHRTYKK